MREYCSFSKNIQFKLSMIHPRTTENIKLNSSTTISSEKRITLPACMIYILNGIDTIWNAHAAPQSENTECTSYDMIDYVTGMLNFRYCLLLAIWTSHDYGIFTKYYLLINDYYVWNLNNLISRVFLCWTWFTFSNTLVSLLNNFKDIQIEMTFCLFI